MTDKEKYIKKMWLVARTVSLGGVLPSVLIAQSALESAWGSSNVCQNTNNYFGITKGSDWKGDTYTAGTGYVFRKYRSMRHSVRDYTKLINSQLYANVNIQKTYCDQAKALTKTSYSGGDSNYGNKIIGIIESYNLQKYDVYYRIQLWTFGIIAFGLILLSIYILAKKNK